MVHFPATPRRSRACCILRLSDRTAGGASGRGLEGLAFVRLSSASQLPVTRCPPFAAGGPTVSAERSEPPRTSELTGARPLRTRRRSLGSKGAAGGGGEAPGAAEVPAPRPAALSDFRRFIISAFAACCCCLEVRAAVMREDPALDVSLRVCTDGMGRVWRGTCGGFGLWFGVWTGRGTRVPGACLFVDLSVPWYPVPVPGRIRIRRLGGARPRGRQTASHYLYGYRYGIHNCTVTGTWYQVRITTWYPVGTC